MKNFTRMVTNKVFVGGLFVLAQLALLIYFVFFLSVNYTIVYFILTILSGFLMIYVTNRNDNPFYRLAWAILIMLIPPIGGVLYLVFGARKVPKKLRENIGQTYSKKELNVVHNDQEQLLKDIPKWAGLINYIENSSDFPAYFNTKTTYLESGEIKFGDMFKEIEQAKNFIFLEYFIIKKGFLWDELFKRLSQKVKEGVLVRLLYDDWGSAQFPDLQKICDAAGIEAVAFNPMVARLAIQMNNRNHRKICVIDGRIAYVGGMNIADEYVNIGSKFGHWKDTGIKLEGDAVHSLTLMFLQYYSFYTGLIEDPNKYYTEYNYKGDDLGMVIPFSDSPTDDYDLGLDAHLSLIQSARHYVYIQTPYLIVGYEVIQALVMAARSGVDVRIVLPHIPDKKAVNQVTKSNYEVLVEGGVRIFEYEPGFVHSKTFVVDDEACLVGTTNMDFRSYYLHFECSVLSINNQTVLDCKKDVLDTIYNDCIEITLKDTKDVKYLVRLFRSLVSIFSGLM